MVFRPFRALAILLAGAAGAVFLAQFLEKTSPLKAWLGWTLLAVYGWEILLTVGCAAFGRFVVLRVLRLRDVTVLESLALGLPVGLVGFAFSMFLAGYLGLYGPWLAVILPLMMASTWFLTEAPRWQGTLSLRPVPILVGLYGAFCLGVMYLELVSPDALNYDSTWFHVVVSQDYAREGRIVPFWANWTKNVPHMASIVHTWGFLVPGWPVNHPVRWMMALHTEFTIFLWTLVGVSALVQFLAGKRVALGWVAFFLFPSIFVYDCNLGGASDHFVALFAAPLVLAGARAMRRLDAGDCALIGILGAGATMTKLQSVYMIAPIAGILACRWIQLAVRRFRAKPDAPEWKELTRGPLIAIACFVVLVCPQAIENAVWYHNPIYPFAQRVFTHSTPAVPDSTLLVDTLYADYHWQAPRQLSTRVWEALQLAFTFSFEPHYSFIGQRPYYGFLFTLLSPLSLLLPGARRLWFGLAVAMGALFMWGFTYRVDRNIQTFLPILVAVTAAFIARAWDLGLAARLGLVPLIALQVAWGADLMFSGNDRLQAGVALLKSGVEGHSDHFDSYRRGFRDAGAALPKDALAVLHASHITLGINRRILLDWIGFQALIDYRAFSTPREAYDRFAALGVSHFLVMPGSRAAETKQEEVIFNSFISQYAKHQTDVGGFAIYQMPSEPPPQERPYRVLAIGIGSYADGVYRVRDLRTIEELPPDLQKYPPPSAPTRNAEEIEHALPEVDAVLLASTRRLEGKSADLLRDKFRSIQGYAPFTVYARTSPQLPRTETAGD
jgi:hypothetical protein